ncbi:hypothetical protein L9F63_012069, partial [Diploptera punctata]
FGRGFKIWTGGSLKLIISTTIKVRTESNEPLRYPSKSKQRTIKVFVEKTDNELIVVRDARAARAPFARTLKPRPNLTNMVCTYLNTNGARAARVRGAHMSLRVELIQNRIELTVCNILLKSVHLEGRPEVVVLFSSGFNQMSKCTIESSGLVVTVLASVSEVRRFKPGQ